MELSILYQNLESKILLLSEQMGYEAQASFKELRQKLVDESISSLSSTAKERLLIELEGYGPLEQILSNPEFTEILVNGPSNIWIERNGRLERHEDSFLSPISYEKIIHKICFEAGVILSLEQPAGNGKWKDFRLHALRAPISQSPLTLSLRRHPTNPWTLERLQQSGWCHEAQGLFLRKLLSEHKNFLVIGSTGAGKTSVVNALLSEVPSHERCGIIEDTDEIFVPVGPSFKLLTREENPGGLRTIDQGELVRQSLRMRPDRIVMGEIRGGEAKDFLMALSTGHAGSFGTLHSEDPAQALIRLEMLIQMGAPHWNLSAIRKLIRLGLEMIIVTGRDENGKRRLRGIHRLMSLEDSGFLIEQISEDRDDQIFRSSRF